METDKYISFWVEGSDRDFIAMNHLFEKGDFHWALFIGHLVIEKLLKALVINKTGELPPFSHNLLRLAEKSEIEFTDEQKDILVTITTFNIQARYDDYKLAFYKSCTKEFTQKWLQEIKGFREWIKTQHLNL